MALQKSTATSLPPSTRVRKRSSCKLEPLLTSIQYKTGVIFKGYIAKRPRSGRGVFQWHSGLRYSGEFKEDKREGIGELIWPDGSRYEGSFHNDIREGRGMHSWGESGELYIGEYHNDKRHGQGTYTWPSGASFIGMFKEDLKEGLGVYISPQGERFEGMYHNDIRDGEGIMTYSGGQQDVGIWKGPKLIQLKFAIKEILFDPMTSMPAALKSSLCIPEVSSRGKYGPKGPLEMSSQTLIREAADGNLARVKAIIDTGAVHVDVSDKKGHSTLFAAAVHGHSNVVNFLLDNGSDVNQLTSGMSVLNACHHLLYGTLPKIQLLQGGFLMKEYRSLSTPSSSLSGSGSKGEVETLIPSEVSISTLQFFNNLEGNRKILAYISGLETDIVPDDEGGSLLSKSMGEILKEGQPVDSGDLYRVKSFPLLKGAPGNKRVKFRGQQDSNTAVDEVKSKEIYVSYGKEGKNLPQANINGVHVEEREKTELLQVDNKSPSISGGQSPGDSSVLVTASANEGVMAVSAVDSAENSAENQLHEGSLSLCSIQTEEEEQPSSTDLNNSMDALLIKQENLATSGTSTSTSQPMNSTVHISPQERKRLPTISLPSDDLNHSGVFSSTRYGSIVSAAQSTTLSCEESEEDDASQLPSSPARERLAQIASKKETAKMIRLLLCRGADPNVSTFPMHPLFYTLLAGDAEITKKLLDCGAKVDQCLPKKLGGYTLLHVAVGNVDVFAPMMVQLLLDYRADANTGGFLGQRVGEGGEDNGDNEDYDEEDEEERYPGKEAKVSLMAGENEGSTDVAPLHLICGADLDSSANKAQLSKVIPVVINMLVKHRASVDKVVNGHSPLSLAILHGHDKAVECLLKNGADPNLCLGKAVGNAICILTTYPSHKTRALISPSLSVTLLHELMLKGADVFVPVRLPNGCVGTVLDFAHMAFEADKRLSTFKYNSLSKLERACYKSAKRLMKFMRNIFRCKALQVLVTKDDLWSELRSGSTKHHRPSSVPVPLPLDSTFRFTIHPINHSILTSTSSRERPAALSAGAMPLRKTEGFLPEVTLTTSFNSLSRILDQSCKEKGETGKREEEEEEDYALHSNNSKRKNKIPKIVRYRKLYDKVLEILNTYKEAGRKREWSFSSFCYECGRSSGRHLFPCGGCGMVSYCSRVCKGENWQKGHKDECKKVDFFSPKSVVKKTVKRPHSTK